jgi:hypothetical protein
MSSPRRLTTYLATVLGCVSKMKHRINSTCALAKYSMTSFKFAVVLAASLRILHSRDRSSSRHLFSNGIPHVVGSSHDLSLCSEPCHKELSRTIDKLYTDAAPHSTRFCCAMGWAEDETTAVDGHIWRDCFWVGLLLRITMAFTSALADEQRAAIAVQYGMSSVSMSCTGCTVDIRPPPTFPGGCYNEAW